MEWQNVLQILTRKLKNTCILREDINREDELMLKLWNDQNIKQLIYLWLDDHYIKKDSKSIAKAQVFKTLGNKQFQMKQYTESVQSYTKCALYASTDSCELSIAYANRSASLFYLNRYNDCIKDIELAIKLNYPKKLHPKIYLRAVQCYLKLGKQQLAKETLLKIENMIENPTHITPSMKDSIKKKISEITFTESNIQSNEQNTNNLSKLKSQITFDENDDFQHASESIDKKYNKELGWHVIANRLIKKGEILFVEKPISFTSINYDILSDLCQHCNCLNDISVPCTTCLYTCYCGEECLNEAWSSYHCWECPGSQMSLWKEIGIGHLALKVLLTCSTTMDKARFNEMQNLITNFNKVPIHDLKVYGITAIMLTIYLLKYTSYFKTTDLDDCLMKKFSDDTFNLNFNISTDNGKQLYISCLLLRHILQLVANAHAIPTSNILLNKNEELDIVASGIYPSASMMNHSCDPNIINIFMDQYLIVRAAKDILTNEEVFNCYGPHYRHMAMEERQKILKSQYCFTCKCTACTLPKLQYFVERFNAMRCLKCDGALCNIKNYLCCLNCDDKPKSYHQNKIVQARQMFEEAQNSFDLGEMEKTLNKLNKCLCIRRKVLYKHNKDITTTLNLMADVHVAMGQLINSIACLDETIVAIKERVGCYGVELLNQLNDLTDICLMYLQKESNTTTDTYKNVLKQTEKHLNQIEEIVNFNYGSWSKMYEFVKIKHEKIVPFHKTV